MSPLKVAPAIPTAAALADRIALQLGIELREARVRRGWTLAELARRARLTDASVHRLEAGERGSLDAYARLAVALSLTPSFSMSMPRPVASVRNADPVHAAMGEVEAGHFRQLGREVLLDEPYQHYQLAGRADVIVVDRARRAMLHIENRTRFPDLQGFVGVYNAKRAYLAPDLARRLAIPAGFRTITHVVAALWSSEVVHVLGLRRASFASVCPDPAGVFGAWWDGADLPIGTSSTLVLLDPLPGRRRSRRRWVGLDALDHLEPRYRGYAQALEALRAADQA